MLTESTSPSAGAVQLSRPGERVPGRRLVFIVVSLALAMVSIDSTIVATALPQMQYDLHARVNWSAWTITAYALGQVLVMPLAGKISDQYGSKKVYLGAVGLFTVASLSCGLANDIYLLVALRAAQALGGGAILPSATGIVSDLYGKDRDRAIGLFASFFPIGGITGPIVGGIITAYWSWRGIFLVNVPIGIVLITLGTILIPRNSTARTGRRTDITGVVLMGAILLPAMLGITYLGSGGSVFSAGLVVPLLVAAVSVALFVRHSARTESPFIPLRLLAGRGFGAMNIINFMSGAAAVGFGALVPLYAQERYGIDALQAGVLLSARSAGMIAVAAAAVYFLRRTGYRWPMIVGFLVMAVGFFVMAVRPHDFAPHTWLTIGAAISGIGLGVCTPASNNASLQLAPESAAAISGLRGMFRQAGAITSVSIATSVVARSTNPGIALAHVFVVFGILVLLAVPLLKLVPDHRGSW